MKKLTYDQVWNKYRKENDLDFDRCAGRASAGIIKAIVDSINENIGHGHMCCHRCNSEINGSKVMKSKDKTVYLCSACFKDMSMNMSTSERSKFIDEVGV